MESASKKKKIDSFDPNAPGVANGNIFGLPFTYDESELILLPVPWEVTVSYGEGTANGPEAILNASLQVDLYNADFPDGWKRGIFMQKISSALKKKSTALRKIASAYIQSLGSGKKENTPELINEINDACDATRKWVLEKSAESIKKNKLVGLIGGDHSTPLGLMQALAQKHEFGILHIDAHADMRNAYEGFTYSHASIMFNALKIENVQKIVSVGLRDLCDEEVALINNSQRRVVAFYNDEIKYADYAGMHWDDICRRILKELPYKIYISFDIDGLDARYCPNTGTPVPGGLEPEQVFYLLKQIVDSGRIIIGFDLVEVTPGRNEWDANVGARVLYKLCNMILKSNSMNA